MTFESGRISPTRIIRRIVYGGTGKYSRNAEKKFLTVDEEQKRTAGDHHRGFHDHSACFIVYIYIPSVWQDGGIQFYADEICRGKKVCRLEKLCQCVQQKRLLQCIKTQLVLYGRLHCTACIGALSGNVLSFKVKGGNIFKGFMFFPYLINGIAIGFIFKFFYTRGFVFDTVLQWCGFELDNLPFWLKDQSINNISLVGTSVWRYFGQNMVLFIGAIMSVDAELYEAAMLDGANRFHQFIYIILPSIKTIVTLNVILSITGSLSAFEPPYVITDGANGTATYFIVMHEIAHTQQKVGLASAMAVVLLVIIFIATILQKLFFKYVFRNAEDEDFNATKRRDKKLAKYAERKAGR